MSTENEPDVGRFTGEEQHGWSPDIDAVADKEDRTAGEGGRKAFDASNAGEPGSGGTVSPEEREGVPPTDTTAASPLGVGVSTTRRGEDIAKEESQPGHHDAGTRGVSQRPAGTSSAERATGIDPQEPIDENSPNLTPGS
jgi:hypothetical protein